MHSELSETIHQIPASIAVLLGDETGKMDGLGKSRAQVLLFDEYVLKIRPADDWNTVDVQILQWLAGKAPAPEVAAHEVRNGQDWLLMTRLRGKELCKPDVMNNPVLLLDCMAEALHTLWSIPVADCPFERIASLAEKSYAAAGPRCHTRRLLPAESLYRREKVYGFYRCGECRGRRPLDGSGAGLAEPETQQRRALRENVSEH